MGKEIGCIGIQKLLRADSSENNEIGRGGSRGLSGTDYQEHLCRRIITQLPNVLIMRFFEALLVLLFWSPGFCLGQKPTIDTSLFVKWPKIRDIKISNDGKYCMYKVIIGDLVNPVGLPILHVVSNMDSKEILSCPIIGEAHFSNDGRYVFFMGTNDSLGILQLNTANHSYIPNTASYKVCGGGLNGQVAYLAGNGRLTIKSFFQKKELNYSNVCFYDFSSIFPCFLAMSYCFDVVGLAFLG